MHLSKIIKSERQQKALDNAISKIISSKIYPFVTELYLYGSCARGEEKFNSDVDLFMVLSETFSDNIALLKKDLRILKSQVSSDELYDPEVDLKIVIGNAWLDNQLPYYKNVRKDGIRICH